MGQTATDAAKRRSKPRPQHVFHDPFVENSTSGDDAPAPSRKGNKSSLSVRQGALCAERAESIPGLQAFHQLRKAAEAKVGRPAAMLAAAIAFFMIMLLL